MRRPDRCQHVSLLLQGSNHLVSNELATYYNELVASCRFPQLMIEIWVNMCSIPLLCALRVIPEYKRNT